MSQEPKYFCLACNGEFSAETKTCPNDGIALIRLRDADSNLSETEEQSFTGRDVDGRYKIGEKVACDATTITYTALHMQLNKTVRFKVLRGSQALVEGSVKQFQQQAREYARNPGSSTDGPLLAFGILSPEGMPYMLFAGESASSET